MLCTTTMPLKHKHTDNDGDDEDTFSKVPHLDANDVEMLLNEFVFFKKEELLILSIRLWWNKASKGGGQCYASVH